MQQLHFRGMLSGSDWLSDVRVDIEDGVIRKVEAGVEGAKGGYALPGMPNCHSHVFQRAFAGLSEYKTADRDDFWAWRDNMYRFASAMTPERLEAIATWCYLEMLDNGYTSVAEFHYVHNSHRDEQIAMAEAIIRAADNAGIALTLLPVYYEASGFGGQAPNEGQKPFIMDVGQYQNFLRVLAPRLTGKNRLGVAFHSLRAVREESFAPILKTLNDIDDNAPIHIHIAEQEKEVEDCLAHYGKRPVDWLLENQPVDDRWCLIHATHVTEAEYKGVADTGAVVGLCPTTEANLGDGIFPIAEFLEAGGRFAIGSDSNVCLDPCEELRLLEYTQRLLRKQRVVLAAPGGEHAGEGLWAMAASGGAQAVGRGEGRVSSGAVADIVEFDQDHPMMAAPMYGQIVDTIVFVTGWVSGLCVEGRWLIDSGMSTNEEPRGLLHYSEVVREIAQEVGE